MSEVSAIGLGLAKRVFQVHGADASGRAVLRKQLWRGQVLGFFGRRPRCVVAVEACASAHVWGREIGRLGHEVRLLPPAHVKPCVKRQRSDAADAEAIAEAAQRPTMRFVAVKSVGNQAAAVILRTRDLLVRQRTQLINAVRGHMGDGLVVPQGASQAARLIATVADPRMRRSLRPRDRRCAPWCPPLRGLKSRAAALRRRSPAALGKMRPLAG